MYSNAYYEFKPVFKSEPSVVDITLADLLGKNEVAVGNKENAVNSGSYVESQQEVARAYQNLISVIPSVLGTTFVGLPRNDNIIVARQENVVTSQDISGPVLNCTPHTAAVLGTTLLGLPRNDNVIVARQENGVTSHYTKSQDISGPVLNCIPHTAAAQTNGTNGEEFAYVGINQCPRQALNLRNSETLLVNFVKREDLASRTYTPSPNDSTQTVNISDPVPKSNDLRSLLPKPIQSIQKPSLQIAVQIARPKLVLNSTTKSSAPSLNTGFIIITNNKCENAVNKQEPEQYLVPMRFPAVTDNNDENLSPELLKAQQTEEILSIEYKSEITACYICSYCGTKNTLEYIQDHIEIRHKRTIIKECPLCQLHTKIMKQHFSTAHMDKFLVLDEADESQMTYLQFNCRDEEDGVTIHPKIKIIGYKDGNPVAPDISQKTTRNKAGAEKKNTPSEYVSDSLVKTQKGSQDKVLDLNEAVYSENFSCYEYNFMYGYFFCMHCHILMDSEHEIKQHIINQHRKTTRRKCFRCSKMSKVLIDHFKTVHGYKKLQCTECGLTTYNKSNLNNHIQEVHRRDPAVCEVCSKICNSKIHLRRHMQIKHSSRSQRSMHCADCDFKTKSRDGMIYHVRKHMDPARLPLMHCYKCDFSTKYHKELKVHRIKEHYSFRLYYCDKCPYTSKLKYKLDLHILSMHTEKPREEDLKYRCDKCDYKTHRDYSFRIHLLNHLTPQETSYFYCYHCNFKSKRKDNLKTHIQRHFKQNEVQFHCYLCDFATNGRQKLFKHIDGHAKT